MAADRNDPGVRHTLAQIAIETRWATTLDPVAGTQAARDAFKAGFEAEVDAWAATHGVTLTPEDRAKRAERLLKAHMARLSLKAAEGRTRARKEREALQRTDVENAVQE